MQFSLTEPFLILSESRDSLMEFCSMLEVQKQEVVTVKKNGAGEKVICLIMKMHLACENKSWDLERKLSI